MQQRSSHADADPDWEVVGDDFGEVPKHRHGEVTATAFLFSNPDEVWAECSMCGARLNLGSTQALQKLGWQPPR
jgi:hypothetical protein